MQTYVGLVRNPADATLIFEACRQGKLPRIQRRLSDRERNAIRSGSVFVWDEKEAGMRRWTDGKSWSASRVAGSFLTYREMEGKRAVSDVSQGGRMGHSGEDSDENDGMDGQKYEMTESYKYKVDGLIKQSFSITTSEDQKLHLISYYGRSHPNNIHLRPPNQDPALMHIQIPRGLYPESTLELPGPQSQPGPRLEEQRYSSHAAAIAPAPPNYPQQNTLQFPLTSSHQDSHWDARNPAHNRSRDLRGGQTYDQARDMSHEQMARPPYPPHPSHHAQPPAALVPLQSLSHSQQHHPAQQQPQTPSHLPSQQGYGSTMHSGPQTPHSNSFFHSYSSVGPGKDNTNHDYPPPPLLHHRHSLAPDQFISQQQGLRSPFGEHRNHTMGGHPEQGPPPINPENGIRRGSVPRIHESPRRPSITQFGGPPPPPATSHHPADKAAPDTAGPGQHIAIPELKSVFRIDPVTRPAARDIPPDKFGRWQEDGRVLDILWNTLKL